MGARFHSNADRIAAPRVRSFWFHLAFALLSMLLLGLAFPSPGWWPLAHVALVPMTLMAGWAQGGKRLFWSTYLASYLWWLIMLGWLIGVTGGGYAALAAYMAIYYPAFLLIWRTIDIRFRWPAVITVPIVFVSLEFIRGTFLQGGMAWFGLGHSQAPYLPGHSTNWLIQSADLAGDWTVSFLVAMTNGFIVDLIRAWLAPGATRLRAVAPTLLIWIITYAAALSYGYQRIKEPDEANWPTVNVAIVQTNVSQSNKLGGTQASLMADWNLMLDLTRQSMASADKPLIVVWPETMVRVPLNPEMLAVMRRLKEEGRSDAILFHDQIAALALEFRIHLFVGSGTMFYDPDLKKNSAFQYLPTGEQAPEYYSKIDRVPFGEYIPWVEGWPWLKRLFLKYLSPYGPDNDYTLTPGDKRTVFLVPVQGSDDLRVTTPICFEDAFARSCLALCYDKLGKRCDVMLNLTNDGWYPGTDQGYQHVQMAVLRSIENRVPMARSVNTGVSCFISSTGRVGPFVEVNGKVQEVEGAAVHPMVIDPRSSLFGAVGTWPVRLLMILMFVLYGAAKFMRKRI